MGTLMQGAWSVDFDDRVLTHLQVVIVNRFRRGEPVLLSWMDSVETGDGRSSLWMSASEPAYFKFSGSRVPAIDEHWLRRLGRSADSSVGLVVQDTDGGFIRGTGSWALAVKRASRNFAAMR